MGTGAERMRASGRRGIGSRSTARHPRGRTVPRLPRWNDAERNAVDGPRNWLPKTQNAREWRAPRRSGAFRAGQSGNRSRTGSLVHLGQSATAYTNGRGHARLILTRHLSDCLMVRTGSNAEPGGSATPAWPFAQSEGGIRMAKEIMCAFGVDVDAVGGWLGSYGGEDSPCDISRGDVLRRGRIAPAAEAVRPLRNPDDLVRPRAFHRDFPRTDGGGRRGGARDRDARLQPREPHRDDSGAGRGRHGQDRSS